jgi:hypothetical protein
VQSRRNSAQGVNADRNLGSVCFGRWSVCSVALRPALEELRNVLAVAAARRSWNGRLVSLNKDEELALNHAWNWFSLHANQRTHNINLLLTSIAFGLAGYGAAYQYNNLALAGSIAVAALVIVACFWLLDFRNRQLVKAAEKALNALEARLSMTTDCQEINLVAAVEKPKFQVSYTVVVRILALISAVVFLVAAFVALSGTADSELPGPVTTTPLCTPQAQHQVLR